MKTLELGTGIVSGTIEAKDLVNPSEELELFLDNLPTIPCGEGGCHACDAAFKACTMTRVPEVLGDPEEWEADTYPALPEILWEELGGEGGF